MAWIDPPAGDELATRAPDRNGDRRGPQVLPDQNRSRRPGLEDAGRILQFVFADQAGRGAVHYGELATDLGGLDRRDRAVLALDHERDVEDPDDAAVDEVEYQRGHLTPWLSLARPLEHHIVDRSHLFELLFAHYSSLDQTRSESPSPLPVAPSGAPACAVVHTGVTHWCTPPGVSRFAPGTIAGMTDPHVEPDATRHPARKWVVATIVAFLAAIGLGI